MVTRPCVGECPRGSGILGAKVSQWRCMAQRIGCVYHPDRPWRERAHKIRKIEILEGRRDYLFEDLAMDLVLHHPVIRNQHAFERQAPDARVEHRRV